MTENVFSKYKVLDFTRGDFGAVCSEYLGLYGLEVIRVETPESRDRENAFLYASKNLNKKVVVIDPATEEGRSNLWRLL